MTSLPITPNPRSRKKDNQNLRENTNIIIKPADKGGAVVIIDRPQYVGGGPQTTK